MGLSSDPKQNWQNTINAGSSTDWLLCSECHENVTTYVNKKECFIATAVYESPESIQVKTLRNFRDEVLLSYEFGKILVRWYYRTSPPIAKFLTNHGVVKKFIRFVLLDPIVFIINQFNFCK